MCSWRFSLYIHCNLDFHWLFAVTSIHRNVRTPPYAHILDPIPPGPRTRIGQHPGTWVLQLTRPSRAQCLFILSLDSCLFIPLVAFFFFLLASNKVTSSLRLACSVVMDISVGHAYTQADLTNSHCLLHRLVLFQCHHHPFPHPPPRCSCSPGFARGQGTV